MPQANLVIHCTNVTALCGGWCLLLLSRIHIIFNTIFHKSIFSMFVLVFFRLRAPEWEIRGDRMEQPDPFDHIGIIITLELSSNFNIFVQFLLLFFLRIGWPNSKRILIKYMLMQVQLFLMHHQYISYQYICIHINPIIFCWFSRREP